MSERLLQDLVRVWLQRFHLKFKTLVATVGSVGLGGCLLVLFAIANLSNKILQQEAFLFDQNILLWIHQFSNPTLDTAMLIITYLGNPSIVVPSVAISFALLWRWRRSTAYIFGINCLGGAVLSLGLKLVFSKTRPQLWEQLIHENTFSYPSGHALGSMVLYGFLAYLLALRYPKQSTTLYGTASLLISMIGFSRLYLGVHWPTDVLGGYGIGFLWLSVCIIMLKLLTIQQTKHHRSPAPEISK